MSYRNMVTKMLKCKKQKFDDVTLRYSVTAPSLPFRLTEEPWGADWLKYGMFISKTCLYLVRIFQDEIFAFLETETLIHDTAQYTPGVIHIQVDLCSQLTGFKLLGTKDHVLG